MMGVRAELINDGSRPFSLIKAEDMELIGGVADLMWKGETLLVRKSDGDWGGRRVVLQPGQSATHRLRLASYGGNDQILAAGLYRLRIRFSEADLDNNSLVQLQKDVEVEVVE
jgi:hypothetical protein